MHRAECNLVEKSTWLPVNTVFMIDNSFLSGF